MKANIYFLLILYSFSSFAQDSKYKLNPDSVPTTYDELHQKNCRDTLNLGRRELTNIYRSHRHINGNGVEQLKKSYEFNLPRSNRVHDQGCLGMCWAAAATALWEFRYRKAFKRPILLSPEFVLRNRLYEKGVSTALDGWNKLVIISDSLLETMNSIDRNGIVPEKLFSFRFEVKEYKNISSRLENDLNVVKNYFQKKSNSGIDLNNTINRFLEVYFEEPPTTFTYNRGQWSPRQFAEQIVHRSGAPTHLVQISANGLGMPLFFDLITKHMRVFQEPVLMNLIWDFSFYDDIHALMTTGGFLPLLESDLFPDHEMLWKISKKLNKQFRHIILAWDVAINPTDQQIDSILVLNSWGKQWGQQGYAHIFRSYLELAEPFALVDLSVLPINLQ